jgi:hypothetical protein
MRLRLLSLGLSLTIVSLLSSGGVAFSDSPVVPCSIGKDAPQIGFWTWPSRTKVSVYIRSVDFKDKEIPHLTKALDKWNDVSDLTGSGVVFKYADGTTELVNRENSITIIRGEVFDTKRRHVTELRAFSLKNNQLISYAVIVIDPKLTNLKALTEALGHELGHNLGLLDCYNCKAKSTLMGKFERINVANNLSQPTPCDIAQVKQAYAELRVRVRPSPVKLTDDEGEEPVDDDTPIVIPKP